MGTSLAMNANDANLRILEIPIRGNRVEDQAEVAALAGFDWGGRDRFGVDVRLAGPDKAERQGEPLSKLAHVAMEPDLDGNRA